MVLVYILGKMAQPMKDGILMTKSMDMANL